MASSSWMASKWWTKSYCWEKLGKLDRTKALRVLSFSNKGTVYSFLRDLRQLGNESSITGECLKNFLRKHKPIINLIICGGLPFESNGEDLGRSLGYEQIRTKDSVFMSLGFHAQFCECFLLSVLGQQGAWKSSLREISLEGGSYSLSEDEVVALCANLRSNSNVRSLDLRNQKILRSNEGCRLLGQALRTNSSLEKLVLSSNSLSSKAVELLTYGLGGDSMSILKVLDLGLNQRIGDTGIYHLAKLLETNKTLKSLHLRDTGSGFQGAKLISSALLLNCTLEILSFGGNNITEEGMKLLLSPLTPVLNSAGEYRSNLTIKYLELEHMDRLDFSVESLALMVTSNKTLESLKITRAPIEEQEWIDQVIPALHENDTLKYLDISGSTDLPFDSLLELITSSTSKTVLDRIDLTRSNLSSRSREINEELKVNRQLRSGLKAQRTVKLKSGRVILCGYTSAGKSTICETMRYVVDGPPEFHLFSVAWKKLLRKFPLVRKLLPGTHARGELEGRTRGCDVVRLQSEKHNRALVWDLAGQKEHDALHSYLFTNFSNSCFLYVCSARVDIHTCDRSSTQQARPSRRTKDQEDIKKDLEYWIPFIASKSRPFPGRSSQPAGQRPIIIFVLTNKDELDSAALRDVTKRAEHVVAEMRERYQPVVDLQEFVKVIDSHSCEDVRDLMKVAEESIAEMLQHRTESVVCEQVRLVLENWSARNASKPVLRMEEFKKLCEEELAAKLNRYVFSSADLHSTEGQVAVLTHLNNIGDIIFPSSRDVIVVNPRWFGLNVLGSTLRALQGTQLRPAKCEGKVWFLKNCLNPSDQDGMGLHHENGFVREGQLKELADRLEHISWKELINVLIQLELCFETPSRNEDSADTAPSQLSSAMREENSFTRKYFIPGVFDDEEETAVMGRRQLKWTQKMHRHDFYYVYIGRRLECDSNALTVFSTGFFPRLQVVLFNHFKAKGWLDNQGFHLDRNLFGFYENGVEVLVDYSGAVGYFVDILVKSSRSFSYTLHFIHDNVVQLIRQFCSSPKGCPDVILVESVIRTVCVRDLHLCIDRKNQTTPISVLHDRMKEHGHGYKHAWRESLHRISDVDRAVDLVLGKGDGSHLTLSTTSVTDGNNDLMGRTSRLTERTSMEYAAEGNLRALTTTNRDTSQQIGGTSQSGIQIAASVLDHGSTTTLGGDVQTSTEHSPSLFYPSIDDVGYLPALWAKIEAKKAVKIHLMCESPHGAHIVPDQQGRILNLKTGSNLMEHVLTFLRNGLTGAAQLAGMDVDAGWFQSIFGNSLNMPIKIEDLLRITDRCNPSAPATNEEILKSLETYMKVERSTQWLKDFLNMENGPAFRKDFDLWKVTNAWVCVTHYMEGLRDHHQLLSQSI